MFIKSMKFFILVHQQGLWTLTFKWSHFHQSQQFCHNTRWGLIYAGHGFMKNKDFPVLKQRSPPLKSDLFSAIQYSSFSWLPCPWIIKLLSPARISQMSLVWMLLLKVKILSQSSSKWECLLQNKFPRYSSYWLVSHQYELLPQFLAWFEIKLI